MLRHTPRRARQRGAVAGSTLAFLDRKTGGTDTAFVVKKGLIYNLGVVNCNRKWSARGSLHPDPSFANAAMLAPTRFPAPRPSAEPSFLYRKMKGGGRRR